MPTNHTGFEHYIARRYLRSASGKGLVSFITAIAVGGVAVGVLALIVVIGVLEGLQDSLRDRILAGGAHAIVLQLDNQFRMDEWVEIRERIKMDEAVSATAPLVYTKVVLNGGEN